MVNSASVSLPYRASRCALGPKIEARGLVGETGDLLLPFRLDRGRADHQHAPDALAPAQELARRDRLDGLAESHFVGQQGAFAEGKVQHAFDLIRQELRFQEAGTGLSRFKLGGELFARGGPGRNALGALDPRREMPRKAHMLPDLRGHGRECRDQARDFLRRRCEGAIAPKPWGKVLADGRKIFPFILWPRDAWLCLAVPRQKDLGTRRAGLRPLPELLGTALLQGCQNAFDMLAGAKPVDLIIGAAAGIREARQIADLNLVGAAGAGRRAERTEQGLGLFKRLDSDNLDLPAQPAAGDFILVGTDPAKLLRLLQNLLGFVFRLWFCCRLFRSGRHCPDYPSWARVPLNVTLENEAAPVNASQVSTF